MPSRDETALSQAEELAVEAQVALGDEERLDEHERRALARLVAIRERRRAMRAIRRDALRDLAGLIAGR